MLFQFFNKLYIQIFKFSVTEFKWKLPTITYLHHRILPLPALIPEVGHFQKKKNTFQRVFLESRMNTPIPTTYSEENVNSLFHLMPDNTDQWMTSQKNFWQEGLFSFLTVLYVSQYFDNLKTNMGGEGRKLKIIYESNIS